jgi:hypothetical protein
MASDAGFPARMIEDRATLLPDDAIDYGFRGLRSLGLGEMASIRKTYAM